MNRDPFLRLALIAAVSCYAIAIAVVWRELGWGTALVGFFGGVTGAVGLSVERDRGDQPAAPAQTERPDPRRFQTGRRA